MSQRVLIDKIFREDRPEKFKCYGLTRSDVGFIADLIQYDVDSKTGLAVKIQRPERRFLYDVSITNGR